MSNTASINVDVNLILGLTSRVKDSLTQLRFMRGLRVPKEEKILIIDLMRNSELYLVFLEELAQRHEDGFPVNDEANMLGMIKTHCEHIKTAFDQLEQAA